MEKLFLNLSVLVQCDNKPQTQRQEKELLLIPNIPDDDVPEGKDENSNVEIEKRIDAYSKEIEKLKQLQLMNVGAVAMLNEVKKVTAPETEQAN